MKYVLVYLKQLHTFSGKILYINLLGMSLVSFLEGFSIFLLLPLLSVSGLVDVDIGTISISSMFRFMENFPITVGLPIILAVYMLLMFCQSILNRNLAIRNTKILFGFIHHVRLEAYRDLLQANWELFIKNKKTDLINIFTTELNRVAGGIRLALQFISSLIFTLVQVGFAFWISPKMTIFVLTGGIILSVFSRKFIKKATILGTKTSELSKEYLGGITDQLNGIKDIKSNTLEDSRIKWLKSLTGKMLDEQVEYIKLKTTSQLFYKLASTFLITIFIFLSVNMFNTQPEHFLIIIVIFSRLWPRITSIQSSREQISSAIPAFKILFELQKECQKNSELNNEAKNILALRMNKEIECQNVSFRYNNKFYALQDINLKIPSNCMTAVVGQSGAGKSTLIDILMGLNQPEKGKVLIDGLPLNKGDFLSLRRSISYVPQDPFLFNESIRDNLLLVVPTAREEQIWEALDFSSAAEFVRKLPNGLDTIIGDRGIRLSGGERQRLVLARAILRKPSILVLDEATSALDAENETKIQEAIDKLKGKMTIIVIAHRLSTIRNADQVIVLDNGKVIQSGGFNQLAREKKGMFSNLVVNQLKATL